MEPTPRRDTLPLIILGRISYPSMNSSTIDEIQYNRITIRSFGSKWIHSITVTQLHSYVIILIQVKNKCLYFITIEFSIHMLHNMYYISPKLPVMSSHCMFVLFFLSAFWPNDGSLPPAVATLVGYLG